MSNVPQDIIDDAVAAGLIPQPSRFLDAAYFEKIGKFAQLRAQRSNAEPVGVVIDNRQWLHLPLIKWNCHSLPIGTCLYTAPPDAGVAAGMMRAAAALEERAKQWAAIEGHGASYAGELRYMKNEILSAIPTDSKAALREVCMNVAYAVHSRFDGSDMTAEQSAVLKKTLIEIVDMELDAAITEHKENQG